MKKIELKNIKINETLSYETTCFTADVFINGKKAAVSYNRGCGGQTEYQAYNLENKKLVQEAETYLKTLPDYVIEADIDRSFTIPCTLENFIDQEIVKHQSKKYERMKQKCMQKGIVYGDRYAFQVLTWNNIPTIEALLKLPNGIEKIQKAVDRLRANGYQIFNTNLPQEIT